MIVKFKKYHLILFFLLANLIALFGQDSLLVEGKIVAGKDEPISNVSVSVKGVSGRPVITDEQGNFTISVPSGNHWLIINPLGNHKSKEVFLNNKQKRIISLAGNDIKSGYDELNVVNQKKSARDIISPHTDVQLSQVNRRNIVSVDQVFQGKVPGMFVTSFSGMPGQGALMLLRGTKSMNTSVQPLVVVDGTPLEDIGIFESNISGNSYNPISNINPNDISSISVLKGPVASTLYGTRASNGLILINTLKASSTETSINISARSGINISPGSLIPQLNNNQYKTLANEILSTSPFQEELFQHYYPGLYVQENDDNYYNYMHNTSWQDLIFSKGIFNDIYFSVRGGSEIATYGLSVGYHDEEGIIENTSYNRFNVRFVSNFNLFPWFNVNINASLSNSNSLLKESAISAQTSPIRTSLAKPPIMGPYEYSDEGERLPTLSEVDNLGVSNPVAVVNRYKGENSNNRFLASIKGQANISQYFNLNTILGLNFNTLKENVFMPNKGLELYYGGEVRNISQSLNNFLYSIYNDNSLSFKRQYNSIHDMDAFIGFRLNTNQVQTDFGEAQNLPENDEYTSLNDGQAELRSVGGQNAKWNWLSVYQQINYKLKDKYLLNAGVSSDFSTRTGKEAETAFRAFDMPFEIYYALGAGWRISGENFLMNWNGLENLLLRTSYGTSGNDNIGNYSALDYYEIVRYAETSGLIPGSAPNETLKPETNYQLNTGIDLSLWGSRTAFSFDYYDIRTEDMLIFEPQRAYMGFDFKAKNAGSLQNNGWEFSFFQRIINGRKFKWDISTALSHFSNKTTRLKGDSTLVTSFPGGEFATAIGNPVNSFYGYQFKGVFSTYEEASNADLLNDKGFPFEAGDAIYEDLSGPQGEPDGVINSYDKVILGSPNPDFSGSLSMNFLYGRWSLQSMFQFVYGNEVFNYVRYTNERMTDLSNQSTNVLKRWQFNGDQTDVPRARWNDPTGNSQFSSRWIEDGSYIRWKYVKVGYTIPDKFLIFKNADFYVSASNIITWDKYLGYDPEFSFSYNPMRQGIDYGLMPQYRQVMFGIQFGL